MPRGRKKTESVESTITLFDAKNREVTITGTTVTKPTTGYCETFKTEKAAQAAFDVQVNCTQN